MTRVQLKHKEDARPKVKLIMDSGAFSAWKLKKPVDIEKYCDFLENNIDWIDTYVALDEIIPGDPEQAAKLSMDNLIYMRSRGLDPVPVFHVGESIRWLQMMVDLGCGYVGLSATSIISKGDINAWYALAWSKLVDVHGNPVVKVHAFGDAREDALSMFPWKSADTSSWLKGQIYGAIYLPGGEKLTHGNSISHTKSAPDIHFLENENADEFKRVLSEYGLDIAAFDERKGNVSMLARSHLCASYFLALEKRINALLPIHFFPQVGLITGNVQQKHKAIEIDEFDFHMAVGLNISTLPGLHAAGCHKILSSYFYINEKNAQSLKAYCKDPLSVVSQGSYAKYYDILQRIVK